MEQEKKPSGALVGLIIIIIILIIGGIYIWQSKVKDTLDGVENTQMGATTSDAEGLDALEKEINETDASAEVDVETIE